MTGFHGGASTSLLHFNCHKICKTVDNLAIFSIFIYFFFESSSRFSDVRMCCFSLFQRLINWTSFSFGLLVRQNNTCEHFSQFYGKIIESKIIGNRY